MRSSSFAVGALLVAACATPAKETKSAPAAPAVLGQDVRARAWAGLCSHLEGSWEAAVSSGVVRVSYKPISNGSALLERFVTTSGKETVSLYHPAGDRLIVTHYCAQGNQPRLELTQADEHRLAFDFLDATDVDEKEGVMRRLVVELREGGFDQTATYRNGDGSDESTTLHFVRARAD